MNSASDPDAGMSLVELIIGLAVASGLAIAIGGLLTLSIQAKDHVDRASKIEASLIELKIAAGVLDQFAPVDAKFRLAGADSVLSMTFEVPSHAPRTMAVQLQWPAGSDAGDTAALQFEDGLGRIVGPIALGAFDSARLEFLTLEGGRLVWITYPETGDTGLLGVRLVLDGEGRQWPVLLWAARSVEPV